MSDPELPSSEPDEPFDLERESLDPPPAFEADWGGDGSDRSRPVRAHVLAALRPVSEPYQPPLDALLTLGERDSEELDELRKELGIGQEHLPELLTMARDRALHTAKSESLEVWAPLHAIAILGQLDLAEHIAELMPLFDVESDWLTEDLPPIMRTVGEPAIAPLKAYLEDTTRYGWGHARVAESLQEIGSQHPDLRNQVVQIVDIVLDDAESYSTEAVTGAVGALIDLRAIESLSAIRRVYEQNLVDELVYGPWGEVLDMLGLEPEEGDPLIEVSLDRFNAQRALYIQDEPVDLQVERLPSAPPPAGFERPKKSTAQARKVKNKRKISKAARKANSRKRKRK
jgi:hypothetical protein